MTETKFWNYMKNADGTTVICVKIDGITVIYNIIRHPLKLTSEMEAEEK